MEFVLTHVVTIMDDFEKLNPQLNEMSDEDRNKKLQELEKDCVCPICPTYTDCAKKAGENMFCIRDKSEECINKERGCMCPTCPFAAKYKIGVIFNFYCIRGEELKQRKL